MARRIQPTLANITTVREAPPTSAQGQYDDGVPERHPADGFTERRAVNSMIAAH